MALPTNFFYYVIENASFLFYTAKPNTRDCNGMGYYPKEKNNENKKHKILTV